MYAQGVKIWTGAETAIFVQLSSFSFFCDIILELQTVNF